MLCAAPEVEGGEKFEEVLHVIVAAAAAASAAAAFLFAPSRTGTTRSSGALLCFAGPAPSIVFGLCYLPDLIFAAPATARRGLLTHHHHHYHYYLLTHPITAITTTNSPTLHRHPTRDCIHPLQSHPGTQARGVVPPLGVSCGVAVLYCAALLCSSESDAAENGTKETKTKQVQIALHPPSSSTHSIHRLGPSLRPHSRPHRSTSSFFPFFPFCPASPPPATNRHTLTEALLAIHP